jgi:hypothetical protein
MKTAMDIDVTVGRAGIGSAMLQGNGAHDSRAEGLDVTVGRAGVGSAMLQGSWTQAGTND